MRIARLLRALLARIDRPIRGSRNDHLRRRKILHRRADRFKQGDFVDIAARTHPMPNPSGRALIARAESGAGISTGH